MPQFGASLWTLEASIMIIICKKSSHTKVNYHLKTFVVLATVAKLQLYSTCSNSNYWTTLNLCCHLVIRFSIKISCSSSFNPFIFVDICRSLSQQFPWTSHYVDWLMVSTANLVVNACYVIGHFEEQAQVVCTKQSKQAR